MKKYYAVFIILIFLGFSYGMYVGIAKTFPYDALNSLYDKITQDSSKYSNENSEVYEKDVKSLIHITSTDDITTKKNELVKYIWKDRGFPHSTLPLVTHNIDDNRFFDLKNLKRIDKIATLMEYDVNSVAYLFLADQNNNDLIIYHQGHDGDFIKGKNTIQYFLNKGYSVLAFSMPLLGMNDQPVVELSGFGITKLVSHNQFTFLESESFSPIKFFVEPIAVSLNYMDKEFDFNHYYMIGISGGGWTGILYPALDDRVLQSYSIAGSLPIFLRHIDDNLGDYEQILPELYKIADYLDLYIMASYGENRKLVQIFNKFDPCCFSGNYYITYENEVKTKLFTLGKGSFEVYLDDTHREHKISEYALNLIYKSLI